MTRPDRFAIPLLTGCLIATAAVAWQSYWDVRRLKEAVARQHWELPLCREVSASANGPLDVWAARVEPTDTGCIDVDGLGQELRKRGWTPPADQLLGPSQPLSQKELAALQRRLREASAEVKVPAK